MANAINRQQLTKLKLDSLSYEQFLEKAESQHKEKYDLSYARYNLSEAELTQFNQMQNNFDVLILTTHNCGDSMTNLPLFAKLEKETKKFKLHILLRDEYPQIHQHYLHSDGKPHIPTYIFFDQDGKELGIFIERPAAVTELSDRWANEFWDVNPQLSGRGLALSELESDIKLQLVTLLREKRPTISELEKNEILNTIVNILK